MGLTIDPRLLEPNGEGEIIENFNRTLRLVDTAVELPAVTEEDKGKVLTVNEEGEWEAGETGDVIIHLTETDTEDQYEADITDADLYKAVATDGRMAYVEIPDELTRVQIISAEYDETDDEYTFAAVVTAVVQGIINTYTVSGNDGVWTYTVSQNATLPAATASDEGKVVMVDSSGNYVLGTVSGGGVTEAALPTTSNAFSLNIPTVTEVTE